MYVRLIDNLDRSLAADYAILDRECITKWLMQFSAGLSLRLHHPVMGNIHLGGVKFSGSAIPVFDRFVRLSIEDLIEKHVVQVEKDLSDVDSAQMQHVAFLATGRLVSARQRLLARAAEIKGRMLGNPGAPSSSVPLNHAGVVPVNIAPRLSARVDELRKGLPAPEKPPVWGWLEGFVKRNPALSNIISFLAGSVAGGLITALLTHFFGK